MEGLWLILKFSQNDKLLGIIYLLSYRKFLLSRNMEHYSNEYMSLIHHWMDAIFKVGWLRYSLLTQHPNGYSCHKNVIFL